MEGPIAQVVQPNKIVLCSVFSFICVAWGQPALCGWLGALSASMGFALFFLPLATLTAKKKALLAGIWFSLVQAVQLFWLLSFEFQGYFILLAYLLIVLGLGVQFALFSLTVTRPLSWPRVFACSASWACLEWMRLLCFSGFSWNPIGLSLCSSLLSMQLASVGGVLGLSFFVMCTNLSLLRAWDAWQKGLKRPCLPALILIALPYLFGWVHLGFQQKGFDEHAQRLKVALVQTSLLPSEKMPWFHRLHEFVPALEQWQRILEQIYSLKEKGVDFLALPEAAVPFQADRYIYPLSSVESLLETKGLSALSKSFPPQQVPYAQLAHGQMYVSNLFFSQMLANFLQAEVVVGLDYTDRKWGKNFNSAFYLKPQSSVIARYDKQILLPVGEYLPFQALKPLAKNYGISTFFTPGSDFSLWGSSLPFSPCICYEETFSGLMTKARNLGARLFVNLTNDNYYPHTRLHEQHLFHARVRCVENGVPLMRACNAGGSALIDSLGRFVATLSTSETALLVQSLNTYSYQTLFSRYGQEGVVKLFGAFVVIYWLCFFLENGGFFIKTQGFKKNTI